MRRGVLTMVTVFAVTSLLVAAAQAFSDGSRSSQANHLTPFEQLIGGQWHIEGSYQEFEWGVGQQSVRARGYFVVDGEPQLVSEGTWYWHPGVQQIRGIFTAIDMPVSFFEYTTRFEGNKMVNDLQTYDGQGNESRYVETWEFIDDTRFEWKLWLETAGGLEEQFSEVYTRR